MSLISFDSIDKIRHYMVMLALEPDKELQNPRHLAISHTFWRDYTCPPGCGGCCKSFSMDLWPDEFEDFKKNYPEKINYFKEYNFEFFGKKEVLFSNRETAKIRFARPVSDYMGRKCEFLDGIGRCGIYLSRPFSCRFELNKLNLDRKRSKAVLGKRLFGRGWAYKRVDGGTGALCEIIPLSTEVIKIVKDRDIPLLERLVYLLDRYKVSHRGNELLEILSFQYENLKQGYPIKPMTLVEKSRKLF